MADFKPIKIVAGEYEVFATGDTLGVLNGGTGATTSTQARINLGLAIGTDVQAWDADLDALAALGTTGIVARTGAGTFALRTITGTATRISVTNGDGVAGAPTIDLITVTNTGTGAFSKLNTDTYGRVTGTTAVVAGDISALVDSRYLQLSGGILTNFLTLHADPTSTLHAATKGYVDAMVSGQRVRNSVRVATTANGTLATAFANGQVVDGVTLVTGDRILIKDQSTGADRGVYIVQASGAPVRATDFDGNSSTGEVVGGATFWVNEGTVNADTGWTLTNDGVITVGTTTLTFTQSSGLGQVTAGAGLTKTGNQLDIGTASATRIVVNADNIDLASGVVTPGTYTKITVDTYGRATVGATATPADIGAQPSDATLTNLATLSGTGGIFATATDTFVMRTHTGTARVVVTNGDGVAGNPTYDLATGVATPGTYNSVTVDTYGRVTSGTATSANGVTVTATNGSGATMVIGRAVYVSAADTVLLANANAIGTKNVVGLIFDATVNAAANGSVLVTGQLTATTGQWDVVTGQTGGLTSGSRYYLSNTTAGALTTTAPASGYIAPVGVALSTTKMLLNIGPTTKL